MNSKSNNEYKKERKKSEFKRKRKSDSIQNDRDIFVLMLPMK